jgi:hypothetical protein
MLSAKQALLHTHSHFANSHVMRVEPPTPVTKFKQFKITTDTVPRVKFGLRGCYRETSQHIKLAMKAMTLHVMPAIDFKTIAFNMAAKRAYCVPRSKHTPSRLYKPVS